MLANPALMLIRRLTGVRGLKLKRLLSCGMYITIIRADIAIASIHQKALFGFRRVPMIVCAQERFAKINARFAVTMVAKAIVRAVCSLSPRLIELTNIRTTMTRTTKPWRKATTAASLLKSFLSILRGLRFIILASSPSVSKTTEHAGSMINSKKNNVQGKQNQAPPKQHWENRHACDWDVD